MMRSSPDLDSLLDMVALLDQAIQSEEPTSKLLARLVPPLLPAMQFARVYRLSGNKAFLQAATRAGGDIELDRKLAYLQAIQKLEPVYTDDAWVMTLHDGEEAFGLLEIGIDPASAETDRIRDRVRLVAALLSPWLHHVFNRSRDIAVRADDALSLVQAQYEATSAIYGSDDLVEIMASIHQFIGGGYPQFHLGMVAPHTGPSDNPSLTIVVEGDAAGIRAVERSANLADYPAYEALIALEALHIEDIHDDPFLNDAERAALAARRIRSLVIVPLVANQQQTGLIYFAHTMPTTVSPARLRALRSLADQLAVVLENKSLLRSTAETLAETRVLYEINRAMVGAQDMLDVLRLLREHLAPEAASITHLRVQYTDGDLTDIVARHRLSGDEEQVIDLPLSRSLPPADIPRVLAGWAGSGERVQFQTDVAQLAADDPVRRLSQHHNFGSYITLIFADDNTPRDLISVAFNEPQRFSERTRRLYEAITDQIAIVMQNQQLLLDTQVAADQLGRQVRVLETLNLLATNTNLLRDEKSLLAQSIEAIVRALEVQHGAVLLLNPGGQSGSIVSEHPHVGMVGERISASDHMLLHHAQTSTSAIYNRDADDLPANVRTWMERWQHTMLMLLPLVVRGDTIGLVTVACSDDRRFFTTELKNTAQTMIAQVGIGLQNIRLLTDTQRRAEQLQRIANFGQAVQATLEVGTVLNIMLVESVQTLAIDWLEIGLYDTAHNAPRRVALFENGRSTINLASNHLIDTDSGAVGTAWAAQEFTYLPDEHEPRRTNRGDRLELRSLLVAPLRSRGRLLGLLVVGSVRPYAYGETDIVVFQQMINQLSVALDNAETYAQSQRVAKNEALVNDIATRLQQQNDLAAMLEVTVTELGQALGARRGRIRLHLEPDDAPGLTENK